MLNTRQQLFKRRHMPAGQPRHQQTCSVAVRHRIFVVWVGLLVACLVPACDSGDRESVTQPSSESQSGNFTDGLSPRELLRAVLKQYRGSASYRDRGQVTLQLRSSGQVGSAAATADTMTAPLSLWYHRGDFYLEAYSLRMISDRDQRRTWMVDPSTADFDSQVLVSDPFQSRPQLDDLLSDPVVLQQLEVGLAGPPPQLEWLLADEPMEHLFDAEHEMEFGQSQTIRQRPCVSVDVRAEDQTYQFWIDQDSGLITRVVLPEISAPVAPGAPPQAMRLTLELTGATLNPPKEPPQRSDLPRRPRLVKRFVPLPPPPPNRVLGETAVSLACQSLDGTVRLDRGQTDRAVTVLAVLNDHPNSISLTATVWRWNSQMSAAASQKIRVGVIADRATARQLPRAISLPVFIDDDQITRQSLQLAGPGVVVLDSAGRVVWLQENVSDAAMVALGATIADVLAGVNVPVRVHGHWQSQAVAYRDELQRQLAE